MDQVNADSRLRAAAMFLAGFERSTATPPAFEDQLYVLCQQCAHFVQVNEYDDDWPTSNLIDGIAIYEHLDSGEKEHDHDPEPSTFVGTIDEWKRIRPDLFVTYGDGMTGPNSTRR